jgi:hypothetical protein
MVSGDDDMGMICLTTTIVCHDCHELLDITVSNEPGAKPPNMIPIRCPEAETHKVEKWSHPGPCPQCETELRQEGDLITWD